MTTRSLDDVPVSLRTVVLIILAITAIRVVGILLTPLNLGPDEAQYWRWGETLEWGYWSKPPLIGWVIHATTSIFGDSEWAIRILSPLTHGFAALMLLYLGRAMFNLRIGVFAALGYILMPGVALSSSIISTDGLLLPIWSFGLLCLWRLRSGEGRWVSAIGLGIAIGFGLLAKYAMMYFLFGLILTAVIDAPTRKAVLSLRGGLALGVAATIFTPHVLWNASNSFKTVSHTADNANWGGDLFNVENGLQFLADQMAVFGPILFLVLLGGFWAFRGGEKGWLKTAEERWLLCFILPPLLIIFVQAVISRAHANWAATAYPAASVLVAAWLSRSGRQQWVWFALAALIFIAAVFAIPALPLYFTLTLGIALAGAVLLFAFLQKFRLSGLLWASLALHGIVGGLFFVVGVSPPVVAESVGVANAFKRTRGWEETTATLAAKASELDATALLVDERENYHGLDYYGREILTIPLRTWRVEDGAKSFAEEFTLQPGEDGRVLIASVRPSYRERMAGDFETFTPAGEIVIPLGGGKVRRFELFLASGFDPVPRNATAVE